MIARKFIESPLKTEVFRFDDIMMGSPVRPGSLPRHAIEADTYIPSLLFGEDTGQKRALVTGITRAVVGSIAIAVDVAAVTAKTK